MTGKSLKLTLFPWKTSRYFRILSALQHLHLWSLMLRFQPADRRVLGGTLQVQMLEAHPAVWSAVVTSSDWTLRRTGWLVGLAVGPDHLSPRNHSARRRQTIPLTAKQRAPAWWSRRTEGEHLVDRRNWTVPWFSVADSCNCLRCLVPLPPGVSSQSWCFCYGTWEWDTDKAEIQKLLWKVKSRLRCRRNHGLTTGRVCVG